MGRAPLGHGVAARFWRFCWSTALFFTLVKPNCSTAARLTLLEQSHQQRPAHADDAAQAGDDHFKKVNDSRATVGDDVLRQL